MSPIVTRINTVVVALASTIVAISAHAENRCNAPRGVDDRRACEAERGGPDALRHFIERTKSIYGLHFFDYAPTDPVWWTREPTFQRIGESSSADTRAAEHDGSSVKSPLN